MSKKRFTLKKNEILKNKKVISTLFQQGKILNISPLLCIYLIDYSTVDKLAYPVKILFSVPKKKIKKTIKRNKIKRRMKEAYRKNKYILYDTISNKKISINLAIIYNSEEEKSYNIIEDKIILILQRLSSEI